MPAILAGSTAYRTTTRKFRIDAEADLPNDTDFVNVLKQRAQSECGVTFPETVEYSANTATYGEQSASVVAQMKQAGITTLIFEGDFLFQDQLMDQADTQGITIRSGSRTSEGDSIGPGSAAITADGPRVVGRRHVSGFDRLEHPGGAVRGVPPCRSGWDTRGERLRSGLLRSPLRVFDALQVAGPNLNPLHVRTGDVLATDLPARRRRRPYGWRAQIGSFRSVTHR